MKPRLAWEFCGRTDPGCVRSNNEDNFLIYEEVGLLAVADGMGGHNSGEVASGLAISTIKDFAARMLAGDKQLVPQAGPAGLSARGRQLAYFLESANTIIFEKGRAFPKDAGMGTTVVAVLVDDRTLTVAHVGDSRLYLFRNGALTQLTEDHSLVGDQLRRGLIPAEAAAQSVLQNILTRALGAEAGVKVDVSEFPVLPEDVVLLATDGLSKMVPDEQVARVLGAEPFVGRAAEVLVELARKAGGLDNVTVVCGRLGRRERGPGILGKVSEFFKR
ncbi:MAG: protein phosphatase 2C domain-containing protein [Elusimicrobia bacterium]|nr:protein phosphatase 2C domain-containing protein [Elusimicrobiota bacterium]